MFKDPTIHLEKRKIDKERIKTKKEFLIQNYGPSQDVEIFRKVYVYIRLIDILKIKTECILDLGSGFGTITKLLSIISNEVDSFDFFQEAIDVAKIRNKNIKNINYICADIYSSELNYNKYNLVFASEFHPFTRNYYNNDKEKDHHHKKILNNIYTSLKEDGHLIISHAPVREQTINISRSITNKYKIIINGLDERIILLLDPILRVFKSDKFYFFIINLTTKFRILLFNLKILKGLKLIYILKKIS
mgnify:CR=1 FL=1|tara:strand:+ start:345 stop:1085 length:741 start_codon:yes stop_codon:yes gene_type:complete